MTLIKWIKSLYGTKCCNCQAVIEVGDSILWHTKLKQSMCPTCAEKFFKWRDGK